MQSGSFIFPLKKRLLEAKELIYQTITVLLMVSGVSCEKGSYFNVSRLRCAKCPPGTFSLGGGVHFDTWGSELPDGFHTQAEAFRSAFPLSRYRGQVDCSL